MTDLLQARPVRAVGVPVEKGPEGAVLSPAASPPVVMNPTALALWELCDGQTAVSEMVGAVSRLFGLDVDTARTDVESALEDMLATGLIR